jgi:hypothetical protein
VSEAEFALLEERARLAGLTLSEWVREALLASGFRGRMGQRFSNWWDGSGFHDNMHLKESITDTETYQPLASTAASDLLGAGDALLRNTPMGVASTAISVVSDPYACAFLWA